MDLSAWIYIFILWILTGSALAKGSNLLQGTNVMGYKAARYGSYYSTVYFSYSGGKGYARYSRVYSHKPNKYPALYSYMFDWFKTDQYKVYKNTPSGSISVCKNYEADENGTYLGIFTCPLPYVPVEQAYCCGETDAQYCCTFWDVPTNFAAACIGMVIALQVFLTVVYIIIQLCIIRKQKKEDKEKRKAIRRIGIMCRLGRRVTVGSLWAQALFEKVHAPSEYRENDIIEEEEEEDFKVADDKHKNNENYVQTDTKSIMEKDFDKNNCDVTGVEIDSLPNVKYLNSQSVSWHKVDQETSSGKELTNGFLRLGHGDKDNGYTNKGFLPPLTGNEVYKSAKQADFSPRPLRNTSRIKFNTEYEANLSKFKFA